MAFDWKQLVRTVAPGIASVFGTPLAGMATKVLADTILGPDQDPDADIDAQLNAAMTAASPEVLQKIKAADQQFKVEMKRLDIDLERLAYDDAASARQREIEVKDKMPGAIAIILFILFGATMWGLFSVEVPDANKAIVYSLVGSLGTMTVTAAAYYHGTTRGSARKDGLISRMAVGGK